MAKFNLALTPTDGQEWTIDAKPTADGVAFIVSFNIEPGRHITATLHSDRPDAREFALKVLACAGDATARTFPHPPVAPTEEA